MARGKKPPPGGKDTTAVAVNIELLDSHKNLDVHFLRLPSGKTDAVRWQKRSEVGGEHALKTAIQPLAPDCFLKVGDLVCALANRYGAFEKVAGNFHKPDAHSETGMAGRRGGGRQRRQDERLGINARRLQDGATSQDEAQGNQSQQS
jgi:hypothetical protein